MPVLRLFNLTLIVFGLASAARAATVNAPGLVEELAQKGFTCSDRQDGSICTISGVQSRKFNYSEPIAILVPKHVQNPSKILLHLHGWRGVCEDKNISAAGMADEFNFLQQMKEAGATNSVMILPMSVGHEGTYDKELVPQFSGFADWVNSEVHPSSDRWILSGHSGAGSPLARAMASHPTFAKKVDSVLLLDAAYGMSGHIGQWQSAVEANPKLKISSVYATDRPHEGSVQLKNGLDSGVVHIARADGKRHCQVPTQDYGPLLRDNLHDSQEQPAPPPRISAPALPQRLPPPPVVVEPAPQAPVAPPKKQLAPAPVNVEAPAPRPAAATQQKAPMATGLGLLIDNDDTPDSPPTTRKAPRAR